MHKRNIKSLLTFLTCWGAAAIIIVGAFAYFNNASNPKPIHVNSVLVK